MSAREKKSERQRQTTQIKNRRHGGTTQSRSLTPCDAVAAARADAWFRSVVGLSAPSPARRAVLAYAVIYGHSVLVYAAIFGHGVLV